MTVAILGMFAGYTIASYGWVLLKGYNITFKQWVDPLNPWQWSSGTNPVPAGSVFPSAAASPAAA